MLTNIGKEIEEYDVQNIKIEITSNYGKEEDVFLNQKLTEVKKNLRWYKLLVRKLNEIERTIPMENRVRIIF
jgi:hypothetical protein